MRKKILLVSLASLMSVSTLAVAIFASKDKDVFKGADKEALGSGVFVVDEESIEVDSDDTTIYHAVAVSDSGYTFNTKFVGFSLDGEGQLYLPKGSVGYFTNVDGLSLGFSDLNVSFTSPSGKAASYYGSYFSFHSLELSSIMNGTCDADLKVDFGPFDNPSNLSYSASDRFSLSQMANSRYTLFALQDIESDLYVSGVSFSTPCNYEEPAEGDEPTPYNAYKKSEKTILDQYVEGFPFVGNGSYKFYYSEEGRTITIDGLTQSFTGLANITPYLTANGFKFAMNEGMASYYQKVSTDPERVITVGLAAYPSYSLVPYGLYITDQDPIIEVESGWPKDKIEERFSSSFAAIINQYEIKDLNVEYYVYPDYSDLSEKQLSMSLTFPGIEHDDIIAYFITYMGQISSDYPDYDLNTHTDTEYYEVYTISLINNVNNTSIHFADADLGDSHQYTMTFNELVTYDEYPLEQIAVNTGVKLSALGTYVSGGTSYYSFEGYNQVLVHNDSPEAALSEVLAYKDNLINNYGYTLERSEKGRYELRSDPFDGARIEIDTNRMIIYTCSSTYETFDDIETAIENGGFNEKVQNHEFPELSDQEHKYMILEGDTRGIYISNCIAADVTALTNGGTYDPLSDSYLFDLSEGYYLGIKATLNSRGNIVLNFVNVSKDTLDNLMTSAEINEYFIDNTTFFPLNNTGDEKLYLLEGRTVVFLDETVYQNYLSTLEANDYEYSSFENAYYKDKGEDYSLITLGSEEYYGHELPSVQYGSSMDAPVDFVDYEEADLENIESVFDVAFPQTAKSYIHVPEHDYIICKSRIESLEQQLIANGYTKDESGNAVSFEKADEKDHYRVTGWYDNGIYPYDFDESTGYVMYGFEYIPDAYLTYPEFASKVSSECLDETLVDAVIEFSDTTNAYIEVPKYGIDLSSVSFYTLDSYVSLETIRSAFLAKGFVKPSEYSDTYYIYEDNYYIRASINQNSSFDTNVQFKITRFNWISSLDDIENRLFYFAFQQNEYIARLDTSDAIYSVARSDSSELSLYIKIDSLDDYYDALEDLGYIVEKSEKESNETRCWINLENGMIECSIRLLYSNIYEVDYSCYSSGGSLSVSLIDRYLQKQGLTGAQLCNDENVTFRCLDSNTSEYYDERTITFFSDNFEYNFPLGEYEYDSENGTYEKEDENCTYSIKLDGNYVTIVVDKK